MTKSEIVVALRQAAHAGVAGLDATSEETAAYKRHIAAQLERRLRQIEPDMDILTCADFTQLGVECCTVCHRECPDELEIIEIETGGKAWICCSIDRALNPTKHRALQQTSE